MNIKTVLKFSLLCLPSTYSFALNLSNSPIQQVTLYPTLAKIERSIPVQSGEQLVTLSGLAANFNIDQLQYQSSNIEVNAVSHTDSALDKPAGNESSQLRNNIDNIKKKISEQNSIIQAAELQNKFLGNVTQGSAPKVRQQAYEAFIAIDQAKVEKEKLEKRLDELEQDLNAIGDSEFNQRTLKFYVNAPQGGEIKISYMVPYARWQPIYKAELDTQNKQIKLTRMAMIAQKTGEDWNNVKLALSTATPQNYVQQVQPQQWWVNYYEPEPVRPIYAVAPAPIAMAEMSLDRKEKTVKRAPQFPQFQASDLNFSTEFRSETKASIPSSQQQIFLPLSTEQYAAKLSVWAIPKNSTQATINAEIAKLDQNWPSGTVKLYRDGDYIGQRAWNNSADETLQMSFGVDDQIQIKVTDLSDKKVPVKGIQSETTQKQQYSVQNLHSYPMQVTIFESEPQSQNGKLTTQSIYSIPPTAKQWNGQPNINLWQVDLNPKQTYKLDVQHQFKYPSKGRTSGF
jgi:uncharacterized protein (TIGR02231 family)